MINIQNDEAMGPTLDTLNPDTLSADAVLIVVLVVCRRCQQARGVDLHPGWLSTAVADEVGTESIAPGEVIDKTMRRVCSREEAEAIEEGRPLICGIDSIVLIRM